jgi:lysozyme family protein
MFQKMVNKILINEGGYVHDENDSGGETKYGICKRSYPNLNIKNLTIEEAEEIYKRDFYDKMKIDKINNEDVAFSLFDFSVNVGVYQATKIIQRVVKVEQDGIIGNITLSAINSKNPIILDLNFIIEKVNFYLKIVERNRNKTTYLLGWLRRTIKC